MPRYIDVEAFIKEQCNSCDGYCEKVDCDCLSCDKPYQCGIIQGLKNAPTVSPDEVRGVGKWITKENGKVWWYECSCCGTRPLKSRWANEETLSCYCPNCGAKMEVSEDA